MKRNAKIDTKMTPQMSARVTEIRGRRREQAVVTIGGTIIVNEATGEAYNKNSFNKRFRLVREEAAKRLAKVTRDPRWQGPKIFEIGELRYQDLRDTYVTRSALAGNDAAHIAAVTGHSLETITSIMKHYLAMTRAMADVATDRVVAWLSKEGISV
jgi:predicted nucleic acid-binding protein